MGNVGQCIVYFYAAKNCNDTIGIKKNEENVQIAQHEDVSLTSSYNEEKSAINR